MNPLKSVFQTTSDWADHANISHDSFDSMESTNEHAKTLSLSVDFFDQAKLILTNVQTAGRGRGDNSWSSGPPNTCLFSSWVFDLHKAPQPITAPLMGLATFEALKKIWPEVKFSIKAPNDIYIGSEKICGLLIDTVQKGNHFRLIVGLGINILDKPHDVEEATYLLQHLEDFLNREEWNNFLSQILKNYRRQLKLITAKELEKADRIMIKKALSACTLYEEEIQDVSPQGDLIFDNHTQSWHDL